jgi:hypothetical protein
MYAFLNDVDAVAAATPAPGVAAGGTWIVPAELPPGDYALMVEVGKEFDTNAFHEMESAPSLDFDVFGTAGNVGQPSVVFRVPFTLDASADASEAAASEIFGYGDELGASGEVLPPDGTISDTPGSGRGRLAETDGPGGVGRVHLALSSCAPVDCSALGPPAPVPAEVLRSQTTPTTATLHLDQVGDGDAPVVSYEVRYSVVPDRGLENLTAADFVRWTPAAAPTPSQPGTITFETLAGLVPQTYYAIGVVAHGRCGTSPISFARFETPKVTYQQLSGCFIATAAFGSDLEPEVDAFRGLRDRAVASTAIAQLGADIYYATAPAAARLIERSDVVRALVRRPLRPLAGIAAAVQRSIPLTSR